MNMSNYDKTTNLEIVNNEINVKIRSIVPINFLFISNIPCFNYPLPLLLNHTKIIAYGIHIFN